MTIAAFLTKIIIYIITVIAITDHIAGHAPAAAVAIAAVVAAASREEKERGFIILICVTEQLFFKFIVDIIVNFRF